MRHGCGAGSQREAAGQVVTVTGLASVRRNGVYVTFWGTAWAEGQGSPARGPDIGLNFHNTGNKRKKGWKSGGGDKRREVKGGEGREKEKNRVSVKERGGRDQGERTVRRKNKKARDLWEETQSSSVVVCVWVKEREREREKKNGD